MAAKADGRSEGDNSETSDEKLPRGSWQASPIPCFGTFLSKAAPETTDVVRSGATGETGGYGGGTGTEGKEGGVRLPVQ